MLLMANAAFATVWPTATCTDSVTIKQVFHGTVMGGGAPVCKPTAGAGVPGDTVMGLAGIVTGIDAIPSAYSFYLQNTGTLDSMGVDVFTGSKNLVTDAIYNFHLARGDSIAVEWMGVENYNGTFEMVAPNNNQPTPNFILRKVSSGNALPPLRLYTAADLNYPDVTGQGVRSMMGGLCKISAPMTVARKVGTYEFRAVDPTLPSDSIDVYGGSLVQYPSPAVGTHIDYVQGILGHFGTTNELYLRDANDIGVSSPPAVVTAYCTAENMIRVVFDRDVVTATATNTSNYSLASFGSVDAAVMDGTQAVILTVSGGAPHGTSETVSVTGVAGVYNGLAITTPATSTFIMGILSVAEVSAPDPDTLNATPCFDKSKYAGGGGQTGQGLTGTVLSFLGSEIGTFGSISYFEDAVPAANGNHGGISVYGAGTNWAFDHSYIVVTPVQEYYSETEGYLVQNVYDKGVSGNIPAPIVLTVKTASRDTCEAGNADLRGELFESMLVELKNVQRVVRRDLATKPTTGFHVAGVDPAHPSAMPDTMFVENYYGTLGVSDSLNPLYPAEGTWCNVTGCLHYESNSYRVCPRGASDIQILGAGVPKLATGTLSFAVYPNPARRPVVSFSLPNATHVDLGVFDVTGRRVATLADGNLPAGAYTRGWLGRDANGTPVGAGVYFYRLRAGDQVRTVRAIMLGN